MIKKAVKIIVCIFASILLILIVFLLCLKYEMSWRITHVGTEKSPDGRYSVVFQAVGEADWPFGASHAKVTVKDEDRIVDSFRQDVLTAVVLGIVVLIGGSGHPKGIHTMRYISD